MAPVRSIQRPYAFLPLAWATVILVLTLTPAAEMPDTPVWELVSFDTAAHAGVFAVLAALSWFSLSRQRRWPRLARYAGSAVLLGCTLFGALIEVLQTSMHLGRQGDWLDLIGDSIGAALVVGIIGLVSRRLKLRPQPGVPVLLGLLSVGAALSPSAQGQDMARVRRTIEVLASNALHGRGYVQQGDQKAAVYLRGRLRKLGLQPLVPRYTQSFTLDVNTFPGQLKLQLRLAAQPESGLLLRPGADFIAAPNSAAGNVDAEVVALDTLIFTDTLAARRFLRQPWRQRVLLLRQADTRRLSQLPRQTRQHLDSAVAWLTLMPKLTASLAAQPAAQPRLELLASRWPYAGTSLPSGLRAQLRVDAELKRSYQTQNLAAVVRGSMQPDSFLLVSAHYDHLGTMGRNAYFPGANDNASGVAMLLELAAYYARPENRPSCSIAFLLFGAEEAGLLGSQYFVAHPLLPLKSIKFLVNLDLLGTGEQGATVVNGRLLPAPYQRLQTLNDQHHYLPQLAARGRAANSDHFPFSEVGVPAFFLYTRGGSTAYHDVNDQPSALSLAGFAGAFGLVRGFLQGEMVK
jgi:aminopeptidase YwaD